MKRIVLCILFLLTVAYGWKMTEEYWTSPILELEETVAAEGQVIQKPDEIIGVLLEANHFTYMPAQISVHFVSNLARRYRPAGFSFDKFMEYQIEDQRHLYCNHLKATGAVSQEYAARLKCAGYYIYSLRKIII